MIAEPHRTETTSEIPKSTTKENKPALIKPKHVKTFSEYRLRVFARDGFVCQYCGLDMLRDASTLSQASVDHVIPRSKGGSDHPDNLVTSCQACNQLKNNYHAETVEDGRAYVSMKRAAFLGYFAKALAHHEIDLPTRSSTDAGNSFHTDIAAALAQFADRAARLISWMSGFKTDVDRVLSRFEAVDMTEAISGNAETSQIGKLTEECELPAEDFPLDLVAILKADEAAVDGPKRARKPRSGGCKVGTSRPTPEMVDRAEALLQAGYEPQEVALETGLRINVVEVLASELPASIS